MEEFIGDSLKVDEKIEQKRMSQPQTFEEESPTYTRQRTTKKISIDYEKIQDMINQTVESKVQEALEEANKKRPLTSRPGSPPSNIKNYIQKQMEKRFGSSLYGFRLPPASTALAANNLRKKRSGKSPPLGKKSFVDTIRQQN